MKKLKALQKAEAAKLQVQVAKSWCVCLCVSMLFLIGAYVYGLVNCKIEFRMYPTMC